MNHLIRLVLSVSLCCALVACGDDDSTGPTGLVGSSSNPEMLAIGTPLTGTAEPGSSWFVGFRTSSAGDHQIVLQSDQPMTWTLTPGTRARAAASETCGGAEGSTDATCLASGLQVDAPYVVEIANRGSATANFVVTVNPLVDAGQNADGTGARTP